MAASRYPIAPAWLGALSSLIPGEKSPLSPLRIPNPPRPTPEMLVAMEQAKLLDAGELVEPARLMLTALSEAPSFSRVRVTAPTGFLDEAVHFAEEGQQSVSISNTAAGLVFTAPGDTDAILAQVAEFTGSSTRPAAAWGVTLPTLEMLALAALLDLRRKAVLRAMPDAQPVIPPPGDPVSLAAAIQSMWNNPQWFTASVQAVAGLPAAPTAPQLQAALNGLAQKQLAFAQNGSYIPAGEAIQVADRFLLVNTILTVDCGNSNVQGRVAISRQVWLQSLISEMLHLSQSDDQLRLELTSPITALDRVRYYLTTFDAMPAPPLEVVPLSLAIQAGVGAGQVFVLGDETVLGRSEQAQVHVLDARASRRHAVIRKLQQGYQLNDAGSTNGTYLNGQFVTSPSWLHEGDEITIGETRMKILRAGETPVLVESDRTVFVSSTPQAAASASAPSQPAQPEEPAAAPAQVELPVEAVWPAAPAAPAPLPLSEEVSPAVPEPAAEPAVVPVQMVEPPAPVVSEPEPVAPIENEPLAPVIPPPPFIPPAPISAPPPFSSEPTPAAPAEDIYYHPPQLELCVRCREPLQPGDRICGHCGQPVGQPLIPTPPAAPLEPKCPNCGSPVNPGARFCGTCGFRLIA